MNKTGAESAQHPFYFFGQLACLVVYDVHRYRLRAESCEIRRQHRSNGPQLGVHPPRGLVVAIALNSQDSLGQGISPRPHLRHVDAVLSGRIPRECTVLLEKIERNHVRSPMRARGTEADRAEQAGKERHVVVVEALASHLTL